MVQKTAHMALLLVGICACGDPVGQEAAGYHAAMVPLMRQNSLVAEQFLDMTAAIYKQKVPVAQIAERMRKDVLPMGDRLKADSMKIEVKTETLKDVHQAAVAAWTVQADGYHEMMKAFTDNNLDAFNSGSKKVGQSKVMVENYVRDANAVLEPYGYHLEEFPTVE